MMRERNVIRIAAVLTVFNRRQKTLSCLEHLFAAVDSYNRTDSRKGDVQVSVFMTDDGCTDGTADAVREAFASRDIHILQGTGSLFWAGGMRVAWRAAIDSGTPWDYYLLLNDDTYIYNNVFQELFEADDFGFQQTGRHGLSSGITCRPGEPDKITYGGMNFTGRSKGHHILLRPTGVPQSIDMVHANILLVHRSVVESVGIFHKGYTHSGADQDYGIMVRKAGFPVLTTAHVCGECERDHDSNKEDIQRLMDMTLAERRRYVSAPTHSDSDYLLLIRRNLPLRYPVAVVLRTMRLYCPSLYCRITGFRGIYK